MQHAIVAEEPATSSPAGIAPAGAAPTAASSSNAFVINLMSSTTPVALTRPDHAGLKRFTFFVSRRREDGRERFRLHMGFFDSQEEAEKLLDIVRAIYPGAWAGLAPGRRLNAAAAAPAPAPSVAPAGSVLSAVPAPARGSAAMAAPLAAAEIPSIQVPALALVPDAGRRPIVDVTDGAEPIQSSAARMPGSPAPARSNDAQEAARSLSSVRDTIASLDDAAGGVPAQRRMPPVRSIPELRPAVIPTVRPASAVLSDSATLRVLESGTPHGPPATAPTHARTSTPKSRTAVASTTAATTVPASPPAAVPAAAGTAAPRADDKPWYAVQLLWSVQPIALAQIPQLAIFGAYTLYGAEGNRDGRRWYGVRLGFFTDAVSAKQVAHYVRADFATVSVVPVADREREQAKLSVARAAGPVASHDGTSKVAAVTPGVPAPGAAGASARQHARRDMEFKLIDDAQPPALPSGLRNVGPGGDAARGAPTLRKAGSAAPGLSRAGAGTRPSRSAPGKRAKARPPGQVHARAPAKPKTLEETLEILGANQLQVENEPGASINDSGVRHLRLEAATNKPSKLSRLFERLSERLG